MHPHEAGLNRMAVMARTKRANMRAPVDSEAASPSTEALAIQSLPAPSVRVAPRTTTPMSSVLLSRHADGPLAGFGSPSTGAVEMWGRK